MFEHPAASPPKSSHTVGTYWALLSVQTAGTAALYWKGVPLFQGIVLHPAAHEPSQEMVAWFLASIIPMQGAYWLRTWLRPKMPGRGPLVVAQVVMFLARLVFVLATSAFSYVFLLQRPEFQLPPSRYALLLAGLFSLFCYMQELERLGTALRGTEA